jgi:DNA-binding NarL/FixJ family response regulator
VEAAAASGDVDSARAAAAAARAAGVRLPASVVGAGERVGVTNAVVGSGDRDADGLRDDDSVQICADVRSRFPTVRVIVMGMAPQHDDIAGFVHAGAVGFIRKDATTEEFIATIRHVADGASALPRALTESLFAEIVRQPTQLPKQVIEDGTRLTTREREIVDLLGEGLSNKEIAARLHIAIHTVKSHVHNVLEKLALHSRLEVVAYSRTPKGHR